MADAKPETPDNPEVPETPVDEVVVVEEVVEVAVVEIDEAAPAAPPPPPAPPAAAPPPPPAPEVQVVEEVVEATGETPVEAMAVAAPPAQQVVYVQAPVPPQAAGNRGFGSILAVVAAIVFGVLLAGATWIIQYAMTGATGVTFLAEWAFYVPIAVFAVALILVVVIVNRAGWGAYVLGSLFVGIAVYIGTIGIVLLVNWLVWQVQDSIVLFLATPFYIVAGILAREVALWFGWVIARRGKRVAARNAQARAAFDEKLAEFRAGAY